MKSLSLKQYLIGGLLIVCGMGGALAGCGRATSYQVKNGYDRQVFSIGESMGAVQTQNIYPKPENWEETVSYFEARYPDMYSLEAHLYGENTLWNFEEQMLDQIFYEVKEPEGSHGFILHNGKVYELFLQGNSDDHNMIDTIRSNMGYDYNSCFVWKREEDGSTMYEDNLEGKFCYIRNWNVERKALSTIEFECLLKQADGCKNEKMVRFQAEIIKKTPGELLDTNTYRVEIFDEEENAFLQEIQVNSTYIHASPFQFEDFNADGYPDLTVTYYYGANGGSASHYIFSPSRKEFVELDSELSYYGMYSVELESRKLYMHYHGSAISGTEFTYQWKNEMDYELIKQFDHERTDDGVLVKIIRYENGKEEILSDHLYAIDEYMERADIWGTYYEDFLWEKEVTDQTAGKKYRIRYAEVFLPEEAEKNNGIYYDGRIYVYDEDTYLVSVRHSESVSQSDSITWENGSGNKEPAVVIRYVDGGTSTFHLSGLIRPDYQSAG